MRGIVNIEGTVLIELCRIEILLRRSLRHTPPCVLIELCRIEMEDKQRVYLEDGSFNRTL